MLMTTGVDSNKDSFTSNGERGLKLMPLGLLCTAQSIRSLAMVNVD